MTERVLHAHSIQHGDTQDYRPRDERLHVMVRVWRGRQLVSCRSVRSFAAEDLQAAVEYMRDRIERAVADGLDATGSPELTGDLADPAAMTARAAGA